MLYTMTFSNEDKILIKSLHLSKGYNASRLLAEFPDKGWTKRSINRLFQKLRETGTVDRRQSAKKASHQHLVKSVSGTRCRKMTKTLEVGQDAYSLNKRARRRFARRQTYSKGIGDL